MTKPLYEISQELKGFETKLLAWAEENEGDVSEFPFDDELAGVELEIEEKSLNIGIMVKNNKAEAEMIKAEIQRLQKRQKTKENKVEWLKNYLKLNIKPGIKYSNAQCSISWSKSTRLVLDAEGQDIPVLFRFVKYEPNKTLIKETLKKGVELDFASLEKRNNIQIS